MVLMCFASATGLAQDATVPSDAVTDKTLVAWVSPATLVQRGAGVVSRMQGKQFDAIVLGEIQQGRWMAGSDFFRRTERNQAAWPVETVGLEQRVQIAIVYSGNHITLYRDGQLYADYEAAGQQTFQRGGDVLIGARYRADAGTETGFFTPVRRGMMWDTWAYYRDGRYYLYYLGGRGVNGMGMSLPFQRTAYIGPNMVSLSSRVPEQSGWGPDTSGGHLISRMMVSG